MSQEYRTAGSRLRRRVRTIGGLFLLTVLLTVLLAMNSVAFWIRQRAGKGNA